MGRALNLYLCYISSTCKGHFLNRELGLMVVEQLCFQKLREVHLHLDTV